MSRQRAYTLVVWLFALAGASATAHAQSLTGGVGSAGITAGERQIEWRNGANDEGEWTTRAQYNHAFTDFYQLRLIGSFTRAPSEMLQFDTFAIEHWFRWAEEADYGTGFDGGFRFTYGITGQVEPDEAEVRLTIVDGFAEVWEWRTNLFADIDVGNGREEGVLLESRFQLTRALTAANPLGAEWRFGVETYNEWGSTAGFEPFDDQAHQMGPVAKAE